ncbi:uncharacterized protein LOC118228818 isoform X3 [Anguilla anguilla]|uniref:uncharacterized protein LOC118228818 isoform X3 n=1 Tax=Anguilla anguilla TaxID=7936 RepID=UPI0015AD4B97|nr:uncharacterized protein LOC118228818 isoform X3 [Anguilla anguilla]
MPLDMCRILVFMVAIIISECKPKQTDRPCTAACNAIDVRYPSGMRYTYRYSTIVTSSLQSSASDSSGLALDCLIDIDVLSGCLLMMKLRNSQIKKVSPQRENSVQRLKNFREALERNALLFSMRQGKVLEVCPRAGEAAWTLNIKRAILSVLQTSHTGETQEMVEETDIHGTCWSTYERRGPLLVKTRNLQQCYQDRLADFWVHSVPLTDTTALESRVKCFQCHRDQAMEEVNCTETVSLATLSGPSGGPHTETVTTLTLLRAQEGVPVSPDAVGPVYSSNLRFKQPPGVPGQGSKQTPAESSDTVRKLCALKGDHQKAALFLRLVFQLRALSRDQLQELWLEASFKCRDDWQPLLDALPACGSEACISIMTDLILGGEVEEERVSSFLSSFAFIPHPTPAMIRSISALLKSPEVGSGTLLAVSAMVHSLCQRARSPCSLFPEVQQLMDMLREMLGKDCKDGRTSQLAEKLRVLKAVGNAGLAASSFTSVLSACAQNVSSPLELRLAAIHAFRRIPCSANRKALVQLYCSAQEDVEVRIAAYQQLMRCPDPQVLRRVRTTLRNETSSQVGAFVWSHLTQIQKTEDPLKQALMESLPDDIISKDFEAESWKYSSYIDATMDTGFGGVNVEGALVFSPSSLFPRSAMANLTLHILGRAFNLLEINVRAENMEPLMKQVFGRQAPPSEEEAGRPEAPERKRRSGEAGKEANDFPDRKEKACRSNGSTRLGQAKAKFAGRRSGDTRPRCGLSVKVFGDELAFVTCDDVSAQMRQLSLSLAGVAVRLLKGQELQLNRRAVLVTEELVLPSLSGLPVKLALNVSSSLSLRVKGSANLVSWSHFSVSGYIKPSAYVGVWTRMGVEGPYGQAGVEWAMGLRTSTSLDGAIQLQKGQDLRVTLNTPEDIMDIIHFSSRTYSVNAAVREELTGFRDRVDKTICTPQDWSKLVGWQLCSQASYPLSGLGVALPPAGPAVLSLRLLKLDRGLHQYLLEAAYSLQSQRGTWVPLEASLHLFLGTPHSTVPRDVALDLSFSSVTPKLTLKMTHPLKSLHIQGQADQFRGMHSGKLELLVDNLHHYYMKGLMDMQILPTEQRLLSHLEAKITAEGHPIILSANITRGMGRKISVSAKLKNLFRETASFSVLLDRRVEEGHRQYTTEAELLLPGVLGGQIIGLLQQRGPLWSTAMRLRYGLQGDAQNQRQECHMTQNLKNERDSRQIYRLWAKHELYCSHITSLNHKVHLRHEEGPGHIQSALDLSYGKHWDEINNKRRVLLSQAFKNQSRHALTSYLLEFSLQVLEKHMNYKTQLLHSHLRQRGAESSTHLKVNYNDQMPLVAGLHWKDSSKALVQKWEGSFNMDTPWLYVYTAHKLSQPQRRAFHFKSEITTRKLVNLRNLAVEGFYREKSKEREGLLHLYTPAGTYLKASGRGVVGKKGLKVSSSLSSAWTSTLLGDISMENSRHQKALQLVASYGKQNISLSSALSIADKKLRKRLVTVKLVLTEPMSPAVELELEGIVEELKRHKDLYQKQGRLHLRQPFRNFPQSLVLQETFTVDLRQARYVLESRAILSGGKESVHTFTLGYKPTGPFVCSSLTHPYSSEVIPQESELCVRLHSNQTQQEVQGMMRINKKDKLTVLGRVQNTADTSQHGLTLQFNLTHLFQSQLPPSVNLEGKISWNTNNSPQFDYLGAGRAVINHKEKCRFSVQFNGSSNGLGLYSSFSHPFNFIPRTLQAHAEAELSGEGGVSSYVCVKTDGEDRATLEANLVNAQKNSTKILEAKVALRQRLLPIIQDTELQLSANISTERLSALLSLTQEGGRALEARLGGAVEHGPGLRLNVSGTLQNSLPRLKVLPPALGLKGVLRQSPRLTEGELKVTVMDAVYAVELNHQEASGPGKEDVLGEKAARARDSLCVYATEQALCVEISSILETWRAGRLHALLSHTSPKLYAAGLAYNGSVQLSWAQEECRLSAAGEFQAGGRGLRARLEGLRSEQEAGRWELSSSLQQNIKLLLERGVLGSAAAAGHYQQVDTGVVSAGVVVHMEEQRALEVLLEAGRTDVSARLAMSLQHHMRQLEGVVPSLFQMNCSGGVTVDRLSGQCSGNVAGGPVEAHLPKRLLVKGSVANWGCNKRLEMRVEIGGVEKGELSLALSCSPRLSVQASVQHSLPPLQALGVPSSNTLVLSALLATRPSVQLDLVLGRCELIAIASTDGTSVPQHTQSSWAANFTNHCPALQHAGVPAHTALSGLVSVTPCQSTLSCNVSVEGESLSLRLGHQCEPTASLSGVLTHSFTQLHSRGLPPETSLTLSAPGGPGQSRVMVFKAGPCWIRASGDVRPGGRSQWAWVTETQCPLLEAFGLPAQTQLNGSLRLDGCVLEAGWAGCGSGLQVEAVLQHRFSAAGGLPGRSRLLVTGKAGPRQRRGELELQLGSCALRASVGLQSHDKLRGTVLLQNNCSTLQEMGTPSRMEGSGFLFIDKKLLDSHLSLLTDEPKLQAHLTLKTGRGQQETLVQITHSVPLLLSSGVPANATLSISSERGPDHYHRVLSCSLDSKQISEVVRVQRSQGELRGQYLLIHTLDSLKHWGLPGNNSIQAELALGEAKSLALFLRFGDGLASLKAKLRDTPTDVEVAGALRHSLPWLQRLGLPKAVEAVCIVHGVLPQLQSEASLSVEGEKLLVSTLNISIAGGHLDLLLSLASTPSLTVRLPRILNTTLSAKYAGVQRRVSADVHCDGRQIRVAGEVGGWGTQGREIRAAIQENAEGQDTPMLQLEVWGRLTDSQLSGYLAVNPETNSSLALRVQGHSLPNRKEFDVTLRQSIPGLQRYLPSHLGTQTQLNHTSTRLQGAAELQLGRGELRVRGDLALTKTGYSQTLELDQSFLQLKTLPKTVEVRMTYDGDSHTRQLQQHILWGGQDLRVSGLYTTPPDQEKGTRRLRVQISSAFASLPHECNLDVQLGRLAHRRLDRVRLDWMGHGSHEQVRALCSWSHEEDRWEGQVDLRQPFTPVLSHLHLHTSSLHHTGGQGNSHQAQLSWNDGMPVNLTLRVNKYWRTDFSRGNACLYLSPGQLRTVLPLVDIQGCGSVARERNSYSQMAELNWGNKRITQSMKYQRGARGMHTLQLEGGAENVSPSPCPSHTFLAQVHTDCRTHLEHHLLLGLCPPHPSWVVSGHHRVNTGKELLYTQTRLSVSGEPHHSSFTLALTNTSTAHRTNFSLHTRFQVGDGSLDLGSSATLSHRGLGLLMQARLDDIERVWLQGALEGRCLQAAAGYNDDDDVTIALCLEGRRHITFAAQRREGGAKYQKLVSVSVGAANQSLTLVAQGCVENLWTTEARVRVLGSQIRNKLLARIQSLQRLLVEFKCQELSERPYRLTQKAEVLLVQGLREAWQVWRRGSLRHALTDTLPRCLDSLQQVSLQIQQELKKPLTTLAGVYQDVTGRWLHMEWRETTTLWAEKLAELLPVVLEDRHLSAPLKAVLGTLTTVLDVVSQQTAQWTEAKVAAALTGIRRRLASLYRLSKRRCEVTVQVPLPRGPWSEIGGAGLTEFLLEEWLLKPLQALTSLRPLAELYRLKRRLMDSPFRHQALLVSNQFVVSFDGHLYEIPGRCALLLAHDVVQESFTVLLSPDMTPQRLLLVEMGNTTVSIFPEGQVEVNCRMMDAPASHTEVTIRREPNIIEVSNQDGALVTCDLSQALCSLTLDGWQHGISAGLLGTNDNEAGNELPLPDGSQASSLAHFIHSWQVRAQCYSESGKAGLCSNASRHDLTADVPRCVSLFSSPDSPLSPCFRVVDPMQFLSVCKRRRCASIPDSAPCRLAAAYVHLCNSNYVPLELPQQCVNE